MVQSELNAEIWADSSALVFFG